jgi:signal transduction histidine kinase
MGGLVADLLENGRGAALGLPVSTEPVDLRVICRELLDEVRAANPSRRIDVVLDGDLTGMWDPARLGQALSNLVTNAIAHGSGDVRVVVARNGDEVELAVSNEGDPIPADVLPVIFDPLARRRRGLGGLGLGLAIVREVARAHGGVVSVSSNVEQTTFRMLLPIDGTVAARRDYASLSDASAP